MRMLRLVSGCTRNDKICNERIREDIGLTLIMEKLTENRLKWYEYVQRRTCGDKVYVVWTCSNGVNGEISCTTRMMLISIGRKSANEVKVVAKLNLSFGRPRKHHPKNVEVRNEDSHICYVLSINYSDVMNDLTANFTFISSLSIRLRILYHMKNELSST